MSEANTQPELAALPGERGMPSVNDSQRGRGMKVAFVIGVIVILMALVSLALLKYTGKKSAAATKKASMEAPALPARSFTAPPASPTPPAPAEAVPGVQPTATAPSVPGSATGEEARPPAKLDKSASSLMVLSDDAASGGGASGAQSAAGAGARLGLEPSGTDGGGPMASLLSGTKTDARKAGMIGNRNFILAKGSSIDCALQTRLDSTVPGMTACVVTRNIFSDNGKVLLIERGSTVTGEYQSNMRQGMARIYVLWTRVKTPNGVVVNLDSPGADALGGAGLPGYVDNHFWKRFGGALMLSLVDDTARFATQGNGSSSGSNQFNFNSTGEASSNMAAEALKNTINIPPTLYKNQGEQIAIFIARDLDFSSVYDVQTR
ncbi:type IV secretion system protein VirB10 [Xanthomonas campestris pv. campestris]|uniref:type IV secretion system protein VirB10 n=1 Tax=Xanthomonas TaxID=338 RepID=UPI0006D67446|nr:MULTISPECIES: type IV secretion system protein VirB10 [Xanthomonas]UDB88434.1 type IV secretion system protein VirB10 [Xanthomonas citri pv. mangiferaeindicae]